MGGRPLRIRSWPWVQRFDPIREGSWTFPHDSDGFWCVISEPWDTKQEPRNKSHETRATKHHKRQTEQEPRNTKQEPRNMMSYSPTYSH